MALIKEQKHDLSMGELVIATATIQDASDLIQFIKQVDSETNFLMREAHEFNLTVEQEIHFIDSNLKNEKDLLITAKLNGKIVGTLGFSCHSLSRYKHKGRFGISILKDYWGYGIGSILMI